MAACILYGSRVWPAVFVGAFLAYVTTYGSVAATLTIAIGNTLEALIGAGLVRRFAGTEKAFNRIRDTFTFVFLAAILSTTISATIRLSIALLGKE